MLYDRKTLEKPFELRTLVRATPCFLAFPGSIHRIFQRVSDGAVGFNFNASGLVTHECNQPAVNGFELIRLLRLHIKVD